MSNLDSFRKARLMLAAGVLLVILVPTAFSALSGSGNVTDIVLLGSPTTSLGTLSSSASGTSASAGPVTSGASAFTLNNAGSNVDTYVRYDYASAPYYGSSGSASTITLRGATTAISDLLWFQQTTLDSAAAATTSASFTPLVLKNSASVARATFTADGNSCTAWTGTAATGFTATASGTLSFKYYPATGATDDAPLTSDTFSYCADSTNNQVYLGKAANFGTGSLIVNYATNSVGGLLKTYSYEFLSGTQTAGNSYCLIAMLGTGTGTTPSLAQCEKLPYSGVGSTTGKLFVLFDPPAYFPSVNQGGALTYSMTGVQWNPYAATTTNSA